MKSDKADFAVLVLSCDKYHDLWPPFFDLFWKYWNDCPYTVYLGSNTTTFEHDNVNVLLSGADIDWSTSLKNILFQIPESHILLWLDDLFLTDYIDNHVISYYIDYMIHNEIVHMHPRQLPRPDFISQDRQVGFYKRGRPYRVNVAGFWDKAVLLGLLMEGESPWNFEIMGSYRSSYMDNFCCSNNELIFWLNAVEKGKWFPSTLDFLKSEKVKFDFGNREVLKSFERIKSSAQIVIFKLMSLVPWPFRVKMMDVLRKIMISY